MVKKAQDWVIANLKDYEYVPQDGNPEFFEATAKLLFGTQDEKELKRVVSAQTLSGSGAIKIVGEVLAKQLKFRKVALSNPTWANHNQMFADMG